jgi:2-polyprenyl-3-methyl-5-hydroxy-6-metoxy-1,4-benzoquinol methylase
LPAEHAASITRAAGPGNLATMSEFFGSLWNVEDEIIDSFQNGGGVSYARFPRFQEVMANESRAVVDATLLDVTLPLIDGLVARLQEGITAADIGCGQGHAINVMARAFPNSRFTGYDFSEEGVAAGRAEAKAWGLTNATFEARDAAQLGATAQYDFITAFDAIHDQAQPRKVLRAIHDALKPDGTFLCVDIAGDSTHAGNMDHPLGLALYSISTFHCMTVSLALGGEGLGTMWGEQQARELLAEAGFTDVRAEHVEADILNVYYICKP